MSANISHLYVKINNLINDAGKQDYNLDFLEGFVYALLLIQDEIKVLRVAEKKEDI